MKRRVVVLVLFVALLLGGCNLGARDEVEAYCSYGAVSTAQLQGCIDHVSESTVNRLHTHAAQYARGELDKCLADSGPFCED